MLRELKLLMSFLAALVNNLKMSIFINNFSKVQNDSIKSITVSHGIASRYFFVSNFYGTSLHDSKHLVNSHTGCLFMDASACKNK